MTPMLIVNPGTEPVAGATVENADAAMTAFLLDVGVPCWISRVPEADRGGRFGFLLTAQDDGRTCAVDMPGCSPVVTVGGVPWESPRLYVDGSSWLWGFAIGAARRRLGREE